MSQRKSYARERIVELGVASDGRPHYAELRFNPLRGPVNDCCVGYKVWFEAEYAEIVRYDSHPGEEFHRHEAGYPEPGDQVESFPGVDMNRRGSFAVNHIKGNCEPWHNVLPSVRKEEPTK